MEVQWFPGHMAKTRRLIKENLKLVDVVIELTDARLPLSSRNPEIDSIVGNKPRITVLNKCDIADEKANSAWLEYFDKKGIKAFLADSQTGKGFSALSPAIDTVLKDKFEKDRQRGIQKHSVRMMIVGIPNVGKSSFINRLSSRNAAKTGDRPGITTAKQWIRIAGKYELLDTPGILWPKFEDPAVGVKLAMLGSVNDEILNIDELSIELIKLLEEYFPGVICERYQIEKQEEPSMVLEEIARVRSCLLKGNELDISKAANILIDDFRSGRLGRLTVEFPPAEEDI